MPEFQQPTHANHTFLGYRGVSNKHFIVDSAKAIRYTPPPAAIAGAAQLGQGVYVASDTGLALDYALDSAWNQYCNSFKSKAKLQDDADARRQFEQSGQWKQWGRVHAVFVPTAKFESSNIGLADFSQINIDRQGAFVQDNMNAAIARDPKPTWGVKTQLFDKFQTVIYPPHTGGLFVRDITDAVWDWRQGK